MAIFNLWEDLEKVPETDLEINLAKDDSDLSFVLSRANIGALRDLQTKVNHQQTNLHLCSGTQHALIKVLLNCVKLCVCWPGTCCFVGNS